MADLCTCPLPTPDAYRRAVDVSPQDFRAWYGLVSLTVCILVWHMNPHRA